GRRTTRLRRHSGDRLSCRPVEAARCDRAPRHPLNEIGAMDEFIILSRRDLRAAMCFGDYVEAIADGFRLLAEVRCASPVPTQIDVAHRHRIRARATDLLHGRWLPGRLRTADGWTGRRVLAAVMDAHPGYRSWSLSSLSVSRRSRRPAMALASTAQRNAAAMKIARIVSGRSGHSVPRFGRTFPAVTSHEKLK